MCPARGKTCGGCGRKNHFKAVCRQHDRRVNLLYGYEQSDSEDEILTVEQVFATSTSEHPRKMFAQMKINSQQKPVKFQFDCGATCNVITPDLVPANNVSVLFLNSSPFVFLRFVASIIY